MENTQRAARASSNTTIGQNEAQNLRRTGASFAPYVSKRRAWATMPVAEWKGTWTPSKTSTCGVDTATDPEAEQELCVTLASWFSVAVVARRELISYPCSVRVRPMNQ